jgi:hypothetical protein
MTPTENWPKPFLLQIHEQAVEHGFVWIEPLTEVDADSLKSRLYRIRRRSDSSMAAFIRPEYHLVMIGNWEPHDIGGQQVANDKGEILGRMPAIFNKKADGAELPSIRKADGEEAAAYVPHPRLAEPHPKSTCHLMT